MSWLVLHRVFFFRVVGERRWIDSWRCVVFLQIVVDLRTYIIIAYIIASPISNTRSAASIHRTEWYIVSSLNIPVDSIRIHCTLHVRDLSFATSHYRPQTFLSLFEQRVVDHPHHFELSMVNQTFKVFGSRIADLVNWLTSDWFTGLLYFEGFSSICCLTFSGWLSIW